MRLIWGAGGLFGLFGCSQVSGRGAAGLHENEVSSKGLLTMLDRFLRLGLELWKWTRAEEAEWGSQVAARPVCRVTTGRRGFVGLWGQV